MKLSYQQQLQIALASAKYHEDIVFELLKRDSWAQAIYNIRAYFWECQSVWDYVLMYANDRTLKLNTRAVRADSFLNKLQRSNPAYAHLPRLRRIESDPILKRINYLRNEAHRFVIHPSQVLQRQADKQVMAFEIVVENTNPREQIFIEGAEWIFLKSVIEKLDEAGFFSH